MRKNAFTLIELLAVIVILSIIALIAVPIVLNIINESKIESGKRSVELYIDAVSSTIARENLKEKYNPDTCIIQENGDLICYEAKNELITSNGRNRMTIDIKGKKPENGIIKLKDGKIREIIDLKLGAKYYFLDLEGRLIATDTPKQTGIILNKSNLLLNPSDAEQLVATITPAGVTGNIIWSSSDSKVATVNNGLVTGASQGVVIITATIENTQISRSCEVLVNSGNWDLLDLDFTHGQTFNNYVNAGILSDFNGEGQSTQDGFLFTGNGTGRYPQALFANPVTRTRNFEVEFKYKRMNVPNTKLAAYILQGGTQYSEDTENEKRPMIGVDAEGKPQLRLGNNKNNDTTINQIVYTESDSDTFVTIRLKVNETSLEIYKNDILLATTTVKNPSTIYSFGKFNYNDRISNEEYNTLHDGDTLAFIRMRSISSS